MKIFNVNLQCETDEFETIDEVLGQINDSACNDASLVLRITHAYVFDTVTRNGKGADIPLKN